jgi:predicted RNase H-related nuclease YkuK (DUF458 family)
MEPTMEMEKKSNGAFIGSIIVIIILVLGGIYLWTSKVKDNQNTGSQTILEDTDTTAAESYDDLSGIEEELDSTEIDVSIDIDSIN